MISAIILGCVEEEVIAHLDAAQLVTLEEYCNDAHFREEPPMLVATLCDGGETTT